jgi:hypothetical protein
MMRKLSLVFAVTMSTLGYSAPWVTEVNRDNPHVPGANVPAGCQVIVAAANANRDVVGAVVGTMAGGGATVRAVVGAVIGAYVTRP